MKAMVTTLTENESQITANSSSCKKTKAEKRQIQKEGQTDRVKGLELKTALTKHSTPAVRGRHAWKEGKG